MLLIEGAWCKLMQNKLQNALCQIKMPMQNYMRATAAPESETARAWMAACEMGHGSPGMAESAGREGTGFAVWVLHHIHRYSHLLRWKRLMLSDGALMCNGKEPHAAHVPVSTKHRFGKLAAPRMEVTHVCNSSLVWRHIYPVFAAPGVTVTLSGKSSLCDLYGSTAVPPAEHQVEVTP